MYGCGGEGDFGSGLENEFNSVILYVSSVSPQPLQSDVAYWHTVPVQVWAVDPTVEISGDGDGVCEEGEICCGDVGPSYPNFQNVCCVATTTVDLCIGTSLVDDYVSIDFVLEPKKNFKGEPISPYSSPVILQDVYITYKTLTNGCPDLPSTVQAVNFTIQPNEEIHTFALSLISQLIKEQVLSYGSQVSVTYTNIDGCVTNLPPVTVFTGICEYLATANFNAVELFGGDTESVNVEISVRLADFQTEGDQCLPTF